MKLLLRIHILLASLKSLDFLGLFLVRIYLFQVFWFSGKGKLDEFERFSQWIDSLSLPASDVLTWLIISVESGGAILLLIGLFTRWITIPMLITMSLAIFLVHWENGWAQESNGIEMAVTYSLMLLILFLSGAGKFLSLDYWISDKK